MNLPALSWMLSGASIALSAAIAVLVGADRRLSSTLRAVLIALAVSGASYSLLITPSVPAWNVGLRTVLAMIAAPGVVLLWAGVRMLFDDRFRLNAPVVLLTVAMALLPAARPLWTPGRPIVTGAITLISGALCVHLLWLLARGHQDDLDAYRRRLRWFFAGAGSAYVLVAILTTFTFGTGLLVAQIVIKLLWLALTTGHPTPLERLAAPEALNRPPARSIRSVEQDVAGARDLARIVASMEEQRAYRQTGLSIGSLASQLRLPEHRVRALINQSLGFRNFNAFLNHYRLREVARRLRDRGQDHLPVLTLALEAGYGSIGPFNRAFRDAYAVTPTEFRRQTPPTELADSSKAG